jgi:amidase
MAAPSLEQLSLGVRGMKRKSGLLLHPARGSLHPTEPDAATGEDLPMTPLHHEPTALALAGQIAAGQLSALDATDAAIARIEAADGTINAVVVRDFDRAREAAKAADALPAEQRGPLHGVPMTVKESFNIAGLKTTWGFDHCRDFTASRDAFAVRQLKRAGAVILGKTNVPVALADLQSVNPIYGRTVNPHDHGRSPGGSSGGGAAALAAGMVPLEYGSDIGGSIRTPCSFCGVTGIKPTHGSVSSEGHYYPGTEGADPVLAMTGPMARSTADLSLALDLVTKVPLPRARHTAFKGLRVLVIEENPVAAMDASVAAAIRSAADRAANGGAVVTSGSPLIPDRASMHSAYMKMLNIALAGRFPPDGSPPVTAAQWFAILDDQAKVMRGYARLFEEFDVIFAPVFGTTAFPHDDEPDMRKRTLMINGASEPFAPQLSWIGLATYPGLPSVSVPVGESGGLPIGMQVIAPHWQDQSAIAVAGLVTPRP